MKQKVIGVTWCPLVSPNLSKMSKLCITVNHSIIIYITTNQQTYKTHPHILFK
uniref:Uncharacterized protein n=1 Tax=Anguilla anguilla TaxID=7936 RepID=A0A0E9PLY2_ANGAN